MAFFERCYNFIRFSGHQVKIFSYPGVINFDGGFLRPSTQVLTLEISFDEYQANFYQLRASVFTPPIFHCYYFI